MPLMIDIKQTNKQKVIIFLFVEKQILHFTIILHIFLTLPSSNSVKHEFLGNSKYYLRLIRSTWGPKWVRSMSCARHLKWLFFYQYFLVRSPVTLRARSTILASVSPFACGSRVISRDSPQRENLLAGYLRTFIRQSLLKLRIVKERAPENEPRIQLGVNSLKVDTYQTCLYITGVSLQICLLIGPASAPYSFYLRLIFSPFIFSFIASEIKICFRYLNHSQ